jgi:hypothetical protein
MGLEVILRGGPRYCLVAPTAEQQMPPWVELEEIPWE